MSDTEITETVVDEVEVDDKPIAAIVEGLEADDEDEADETDDDEEDDEEDD
jgi:hypothetical protein